VEQVVPREELCSLIEPVYPKVGQGSPPVGVERMLRLYFLQQWFNLSDTAVEESLDESVTLRGFVKVRCRGIAKNGSWVFAFCGLGNLFLARKKLLGMPAAYRGRKPPQRSREANAKASLLFLRRTTSLGALCLASGPCRQRWFRGFLDSHIASVAINSGCPTQSGG
jgi:hypothetical protein